MKVMITGSAAAVTSTITKKEIETLAKYNPKALTLYGGENGKEPLFSIGVGNTSCGKISKYGIEFGQQTAEGGNATVTVVFCNPVDDPKEYIAENFGSALLNLAKLEETIPAAVAQIEAEKAAVLENITIA